MHIAQVVPSGKLQVGETVATGQINSVTEILDSRLNVSQLIVSLATTDQDLALVFWLGIIDQLYCSVQLADGVCDPTLLKQQQTVLSSRDDSQLAERSSDGPARSAYTRRRILFALWPSS